MASDEKSRRKAEALKKRIEALVAPAWLPVFEPGLEGPSRFGTVRGPMTLGPRDAWPICPRCYGPLSPLLELDLRDSPAPHLRDDALVQLFWCETWERREDPVVCPTEGGYFARRRRRTGQRTDGPAPVRDRPPHSIAGWIAVSELPTLDLTDLGPVLDACDPAVVEHLLRSVHIDHLDWTTLAELDGAAVYRAVADRLEALPRIAHKLAGYPTFVQQYRGPPYANQVFQLETSAPFDVNFGDGAGHLLAQPDGALGFFWSCL